MNMSLVTICYLGASVCFIQALKGLSNPRSALVGNAFGLAGMAIAVATTVWIVAALREAPAIGLGLVAIGVVSGGTIGSLLAKKVEMTKMPELVAAMHSLIGLAAVFIAISAVIEPAAFGITPAGVHTIPSGNRIELFIGTLVGAITFSGSVIAFGKLSGKYRFRLFQGAPVTFRGQHAVNLVLAAAMLG
ncbi:MAG: H+-translocating transhydrogenase subunit beta, partial [Caballeronia sp.]|nr:H+-translocating transhydrogenase subunit beta [Caballeronia sp.]